eukprot:Rhum_TRINITY_DN14855_c1_g1::Rhum_TRINITY_DN14855_c1_g1_i1::g.122519::m.122519
MERRLAARLLRACLHRGRGRPRPGVSSAESVGARAQQQQQPRRFASSSPTSASSSSSSSSTLASSSTLRASTYPATLVACQSRLAADPESGGVNELFGASGRPDAVVVYSDLCADGVRLSDASRADILLAYALDLRADHPHPPAGGTAPVPTPLKNFFAHLLEGAPQQTPLLFAQYLEVARAYGCLEVTGQVLRQAFTTYHGRVSSRDLLHTACQLCRELGSAAVEAGGGGGGSSKEEKPWTYALSFIGLAKEHAMPIDHQTVGLFFQAVAASGDLDVIERGAELLKSYPYIGKMLRRSPQYYEALLGAYACVGDRRDALDLCDALLDGGMEECGVEPTLAHYERLLLLCAAAGYESRGDKVMEDALAVPQNSREESCRFEAACISFLSACGRHGDAARAIGRADADGSLDASPPLAAAALRHLASAAPELLGHEGVAAGLSLTERLEASYRRSSPAAFAPLRPLFLGAYCALGGVRGAEPLLDEARNRALGCLAGGETSTHRAHLKTLYERAGVRWQLEKAHTEKARMEARVRLLCLLSDAGAVGGGGAAAARTTRTTVTATAAEAREAAQWLADNPDAPSEQYDSLHAKLSG